MGTWAIGCFGRPVPSFASDTSPRPRARSRGCALHARRVWGLRVPGLRAPVCDSSRSTTGYCLPVEDRFPALSGVHPHAQQAAEAAEAAGAQGKFWETHTLLFARQEALRTKDLIRHAEELTLDVDRFREELKNESYSERVRADFLAGVQNGVYGTPGLFLNGVRYDGQWGKESLRSVLML